MENGDFDAPGGWIDVLIQPRQEQQDSVEAIIKDVEGAQGRILHVYSPFLIVARIPQAAAAALARHPAVWTVDSGAISAERLAAAPVEARLALAAWNEQLQKRSEAAPGPRSMLAWDAPGRQPPDPPAHLRKALRGHEEKALREGEDEQHKDGGDTGTP